MTVSDEKLSAFLDAELSEQEMEWVRQQLIEDENLANRLAEIALVDEQIASHYSRIDERPMPAAVTQLFIQQSQQHAGSRATQGSSAHASSPRSSNIIRFPFWKRAQRSVQRNVAIAACTLLVIGFGMVQLLPSNNEHKSHWNAVAQALEKSTSGATQQLNDGSRITPRLTFINLNGEYCRQYQLAEHGNASENIACRSGGQWKVIINVPQDAIAEGDYKTASGGSMVDEALDGMMQGEAFDSADEQKIIQAHWKNK